jgi:hypothetical protein
MGRRGGGRNFEGRGGEDRRGEGRRGAGRGGGRRERREDRLDRLDDRLDRMEERIERLEQRLESPPIPCRDPQRVLTVDLASSDTIVRSFTTTGSFFRVNYLLDFTDPAPTTRSATLTIVRVSDQQVVGTQPLSETTPGVPSSFDVNARPGTYELRVDIEPKNAATYSVTVDDCLGTTMPTTTTTTAPADEPPGSAIS